MTTNVKLVSVILPVYNQGDHIAQIVAEHEEALLRLSSPHELLLIVNGCRDRSLEACKELRLKYPPVRVVECEHPGWGRAVRRGLAEARGDIICYTNSARTSSKELSLFLVYALIYPDVVIKANRKVREGWRRRLGSLLYNIQCRTLFDLPYWDLNGTPKVFPRSFGRLLELQREDDLIDLEFNVVCREQQYPMLEIPIYSTRRHGGESTTGYRSAVRMYWGAFRMWRGRRQGEVPH